MNSDIRQRKAEGLRVLGVKGEIKVRLVLKLTTLIAILISLVAVSSSLVIYNLSFKALKDEIRNNLILLASNAAATIDASALSTITRPEDEGNETYLKLQKQLQNIKEASKGKIRYIYTLTQKDGEYKYVLDASPIEDERNHSSIDEKFVAQDYTYVEKAFTDATAEKEPTPDDVYGGIIQTGYAPVKDRDGKVTGVLAMDMDVTVLAEKERSMVQARMMALLFAVVLALLSGVSFSIYLTRPILALTKGTKKVAEGDFDTVVHVSRNDELGQLAASFNVMTHDLKVSHEELKRYSLELEDKVAQRTAELSCANKEIRDILDNMSQAVFTIDEELKFNEQYSRFAASIFGDIDFNGKNILDAFFSSGEEALDRANMAVWLRKVFNDTSILWDNLKALQPVKEVKVNVAGMNRKQGDKYISLEFQPIYDELLPGSEGRITKVMVIVQDITERKLLELEMEQKEKEYKDNINQIVEIIKADKEMFEEYINEARPLLDSFAPQLIALKDEPENMDLINGLYRVMHTMKGNSKAFRLERIAGEAHSIENIFTAIKKGERKVTDDLLDEVFKKLDKLTALFNETLDMYHKIVHGMSVDTGKARNEKRLRDESEFLRVKVQEFDRLVELVDKAEGVLDEDRRPDKSKGVNQSAGRKIRSVFVEIREELQAMRKIELGRLFNRFPRMVRDMSMELGKKVRLILSGENVMVDKNIYDRIGDPLVHIIRNSLDHGIEKPEVRLKAGKLEEGTIELSARLEGASLLVEASDDGRGLDLDKIKASAVEKGLVAPAKALGMSDQEAMELIFLPGFSTNERISSISGRGVGMDVVKTYVRDGLKGKITMETSKDKGLRILLEIPV